MDMHLDNYEIQKIGTKINDLCRSNLTYTTYPGQKFSLFQT